MTHLDLPLGGWAEIRSYTELSERARRDIQRAFSKVSSEGLAAIERIAELRKAGEVNIVTLAAEARLSIADMDALNEANDLCIVAFVEKWSFDRPITLDTVLDLHPRDFDFLRDKCAEALPQLFTDFRPDPNGASPTVPSGA